jgi:hypothetical protein
MAHLQVATISPSCCPLVISFRLQSFLTPVLILLHKFGRVEGNLESAAQTGAFDPYND